MGQFNPKSISPWSKCTITSLGLSPGLKLGLTTFMVTRDFPQFSLFTVGSPLGNLVVNTVIYPILTNSYSCNLKFLRGWYYLFRALPALGRNLIHTAKRHSLFEYFLWDKKLFIAIFYLL